MAPGVLAADRQLAVRRGEDGDRVGLAEDRQGRRHRPPRLAAAVPGDRDLCAATLPRAPWAHDYQLSRFQYRPLHRVYPLVHFAVCPGHHDNFRSPDAHAAALLLSCTPPWWLL